jgi:DNA-binding transcriptional MocR family regulator
MQLVAALPKGLRDRSVCKQGARRDLWHWPLSSCYLEKALRQGLILGFGSTTPEEIPKAVRRLRTLIESQ